MEFVSQPLFLTLVFFSPPPMTKQYFSKSLSPARLTNAINQSFYFMCCLMEPAYFHSGQLLFVIFQRDKNKSWLTG